MWHILHKRHKNKTAAHVLDQDKRRKNQVFCTDCRKAENHAALNNEQIIIKSKCEGPVRQPY